MKKDTHKGQVHEIRRLVEMLGGRAYVLSQSGRLYGSAGLPDIWCILNGHAFWVEVKVGKDKLKPAQKLFKADSESAGVPVVVGRACDVVDYIESLEDCT